MEKRRLGKTNLDVSAVGFGGITIQSANEDIAYEVLLEAHKQGINFIDTARGYKTSEELIGSALKRVGRDKFYLATKSMARDYEGIKLEFETSLLKLQTDYIDLFQFHNVRTKEQLDQVLSSDGAYRAVKEYQDLGIIKHIGITSHSADVLDLALDTDYFSTIQFPYNPVELQGEEVFKKAKSKDIGVIIMKPLAGGAITKGELSLRFVLENENVTTVIPGMETVDLIKENSKVGQNIRRLTDEEREELHEETKLLGSRFCRRCGYCQPCPIGIDIPSNFLFNGYFLRYNLPEWAIERYRAQEVRAVDCIECGECETKCPYDLPIIEMLKEVEENLG